MLQKLLNVTRRIDALNRSVGVFIRWLVVILIFIAAYNAIARYIGKYLGINLSSNSFLEIQWYLFSMIFLLGGGYGLYHNVHIRVDVIFNGLSKRSQSRLNFLGAIFFLMPFSLFAIIVSLDWVFNSWAIWEMSPDPGGLPLFPIKTIIPVGFLLLFLQAFSEAVKSFMLFKEENTKESSHINTVDSATNTKGEN